MIADVPGLGMPELLRAILKAGLACGVLATWAAAQGAPKATAANPLASARQAISLAERGRCREALPILKRATPRLRDKQLRYHSAMAAARCAMGLDDTAAAVDALMLLRRDFPDDPEVLYVCTHFFSHLANRSAQKLAETFPASPQLAKLNAEALESWGKWDEAVEAYRKILTENPGFPEIHFRIASILLDKSSSAEAAAEAKKELEEELKINPNSAAAEFALGEIARRAGDWDSAVQHFSRASQLDVGFLEAYLALGMSLNSAGKYAEAIAPLKVYVQMDPGDPAGHYQLATAYSRTGNKVAATRELQLQREAQEKRPVRRAPTAPVPQ
jgi:tetratricopeptide (TPR) repeat protein